MKRAMGTLVTATLALALSGCNDSRPATPNAAAAPATAQAAAPPAPAAEAPFVAGGPLIVENQVDVAAERDGVIAAIYAETGRSVRKGELLAKLDDRQLTADRDAAAARMRSVDADLKNWDALSKVAATDVERAEEMWKAQLITKQQLEHTRYQAVAAGYEVERERENLRNAEATLRSLELELAKTRIVAPFDGLVARRYVRVGERVAANSRLFWVTATAPLRIKFTLPERYLGSVRPGSEVTVVAGSVPGERRAKIILATPVVDPSSGTFEVTAELLGKNPDLRPGMTASVRLPEVP